MSDELKDFNAVTKDVNDEEFLPESEIEIRARAEEIERGLEKDAEKTIMSLLAMSIARDEYHARRTKRASNIANLSQALTLASRIKGVADPNERDVIFDILEFVHTPEKALEQIIVKRAAGEISSKQANDLALLLDKLTDQTKVKELWDAVNELKEQAPNTKAEMTVVKAQDMLSKETTH